MEWVLESVWRRLFNLYPGEIRRALCFTFLAFIYAIGSACGFTLADGLFLEHLGSENLPWAYLATALGMFVVAAGFLAALNKVSLKRIFLFVVLLGLFIYLCAFFLALNAKALSHPWFWFALKVFCRVFYVVLGTCFWTFIDQFHDLQDAKRMYCLFNSGIFLGEAVAGAAVALFLPFVGLTGFLILIVVALAITALAVRQLADKTPRVYDDHSEGDSSSEQLPLKKLWKVILSSPFTMYLMATNITFQMLTIVTEFNYMGTFEKFFEGADGTIVEGELTRFLGKCFAISEVANIIIGLLFYGRGVRRFGIYNAIFFTPMLFTAVFLGWSLHDAIFIAVIGFFLVESFIYTIDDNNFTLLLNAVPPRIKSKVRVLVESFFDPLAIFLSALMLMALGTTSRIFGLCLGICTIGIAFGVRKYYSGAILTNLAENAIRFERETFEWFGMLGKKEKKQAKQNLVKSLKSDSESTRLFACNALLQLKDAKLLPELLANVEELGISSKIKLLKLLENSPFATDTRVIDLAVRWTRSSSSSNNPLDSFHSIALQESAQFYLARWGLLNPEKALMMIDHPSIIRHGAAILALFTAKSHQSTLDAAENQALAAKHLQAMIDSEDEEELSLGLTILGLADPYNALDTLLPFLKHPSASIACVASESIERLTEREDVRYQSLFLSELTSSPHNVVRLNLLKALWKIGDSTRLKEIIFASAHFRPNERRLAEELICDLGLRTVPLLLAITKDPSLHPKYRLLAGRSLGRLSAPQLRANVYEIVYSEIERAYFYFYHCHTVQKNYPEHDLGVLEQALLTGYYSVMDFVIQLLAIIGSVEDCELLSRSLRSHHAKTHSNAVETLQRTCETKVFRLIEPLISDGPIEEKLLAYQQGKRVPLALTELLDAMEESPSLVDQIISITLQAQLDLPYWRETLRKQMVSNEEIFHHFAYELLES